jgi:membrane fusion protein (multidrug efflux system)
MIKRLLIVLVLLVLVCGGLVGFNLFRSKMIKEYFAHMQMPAVTVSTTEATPVTWTPQIDAIGTLSAKQGVDVATQTSGVVKTVAFHANDNVKGGQLLVQIEDAVERADLLAAQAAVARDRAALARAQTLSKSGVSSTAALQEAQSALATSESLLNKIGATLDLKAIEAPFSGTIGIPRVDVGQYVQPGTTIATLQELSTMRADFTVPEQDVASVKMGQSASFGLSDQEFRYPGKITGVDPKIDPQTRLVSVRAEVQNTDGQLRPGQFIRARVALPPEANIMALPQTSVVTSLYGDYVYVIEPAKPTGGSQPAEPAPATTAGSGNKEPALKASQTFVQVGRRQGNMIEIVKGVSPGQTVVTSGQNKLANNAPVTINNAIDPAKLALGNGNGSS